MQSPTKTALPERFWAKVNKDGPTPEAAPHLGNCWEWTAARTSGYGAFRVHTGVQRKTVLAHRLSHFDAGGEIASGLDIDHKCYNRACLRPSHLRAVPHAHNIQNLTGAYARSKTGVRGVSELKCGTFRAEAQVDSKRYNIGRFGTLDEAEAAITAWRRENMPGSLMDQELPLAA